MKQLWKYVLGGAMVISMVVPAMAKDHGRDRDHHTSREWREHREREHRAEYRHARWNDHDRDDRHKGWDKGHKTGWHGSSLPPGQAKKHRDHDRDEWARRHHRHHHTTYARGPVVTPRNTSYPARNYPTQQPQHGRGPIPVPNVGQQTTTTAQKPSGQGPIQVPGR